MTPWSSPPSPGLLRARAAGDWYFASQLADCGNAGELRARTAAGDEHAARRLAELLADRGDLEGLEELRAHADAGLTAAAPLVWLLSSAGT